MDGKSLTYDDWLALTDEERDNIHFNSWNVYDRDGLPIAFMAAARLALRSKWKVLDINTGIYHGGEHVLHMTVSDEDFKQCPAKLQEQFEGFRVIWMPLCGYPPRTEHPDTLDGKWKAENGDYEFDVRLTDSGASVEGKKQNSNEILVISNVKFNGLDISFSVTDLERNQCSQHQLTLIGFNLCANQTSKTDYYRKIKR